jgi:hypothetical protein
LLSQEAAAAHGLMVAAVVVQVVIELQQGFR